MNQLSFYRALVVLNGAVPLLMLVWDAYRGQLGANSVNNALHITGILSLVFLFLSLLMTPLRWVTHWGGWIAFRRALGLYGFFYSIVHLAIYVGFDRGLSLSSTFHEIWMRRFLQLGVAAVLLMVPLAVTSTHSMVRKMGPKRWKLLHRGAYLVAVLGVVHYYMLVKSDVRQPLAFAGVLAFLLGARFARHYFDLLRAGGKNGQAPANVMPAAPANAIEASSAALEKLRQRWTGDLKVAAIFQETADVKTLRLTAPDGGDLPFAYLPGQFLNVQLTIDGKRVNRSYTIASSPTRPGACELSIKREPQGLASRFIHGQLEVGDLLKVSGPAGKFVFTGHEADGVVLIAGGVGITPMMSMVRYLTDRAWLGEIYFLIVAKSEQDLIFHDELQWLKARHARLHVCATLTRCDPASTWNGDRGRPTESLLKRFVPELPRLPVYLCGPNEMMEATRELLLGLGVAGSQIKTEAFASRKAGKPSTNGTPKPSNSDLKLEDPPGARSLSKSVKAGRIVAFTRSNLRAEVTAETSVLEAAEASSIELPNECRSGVCGQCKTRLIEGTVTMECEEALSSSEKADGWILACQARPQSNIVVQA